MQEVFRYWRRSIREPISLFIVALAATLCVISGPFGTLQSFSALHRAMYWLPNIIFGGCVSLFIRIVLRLYFPQVAKSLIETATVAVFVATFGGVLLFWSEYFTALHGGENYLPSRGMQLLYLALVAGSFLWLRNFVIEVISQRATANPDTKVEEDPVPANIPDPAPASGPRLLRRLPDALRSPVLFMTAEDHFVAVHTEKGVHRLRMRFKDAIDEMEGVEGFFTHRSYWVSRAAIAGAQKNGAAWRLLLKCGQDIPVSRKHQPDLEAAGLLRLEAGE